MRRLAYILPLGLPLIAVCVLGADWWAATSEHPAATYVGRESCVQCHAAQAKLWDGSPHDQALALATPKSVLGDFHDREFQHQGLTSKMFRRGDKYFVRTDGPDGKLADFEVKYVIGVDPLQQYMVEFPDGRVQVLRLSWDVKNRRWFYLYPPDVKNERLKPGDPLHWTGPAMNWNHMCAECHSTNVHKNFGLAANKFHTSFSEINVSCEACHGPGSIHVAAAAAAAARHEPFGDPVHGYGLARLKGESSKSQIEACAQCHARRRMVHPDWRPGAELLDYYAPATIDNRLYYADGQVLDEDYEYGSFLQCKMFAKGIRCSDCHDPHSTKLLRTGNETCTSCHQHPAAKYDVTSHHHHAAGSTGAACVNCHMPVTHYMVVDPRRDHNIRIPRPDLSVKLGTPNACTGCHLEIEKSGRAMSIGPRTVAAALRDAQAQPSAPGAAAPPGALPPLGPHEVAKQPAYPSYYADYFAAAKAGDPKLAADIRRLDLWALKTVEKWYGPRHDPLPPYAIALDAARRNRPEAEKSLFEIVQRNVYPPIIRATALEELGHLESPFSAEAIVKGLGDPDPLVRAMAAGAVAAQKTESSSRIRLLVPLLSDPVRLVRVDAAQALLSDWTELTAEQRQPFDRAIAEYREGQRADSDQPEANFNLGQLSEIFGQLEDAEKFYRASMRLSSQFYPAQFRLAMLYVREGKKDRAEAVYRGIIKDADESGQPQDLTAPVLVDAYYYLGLLLNEKPDGAAAAEKSLLTAWQLDNKNVEVAYALTTFYADHGRWNDAGQFAKRLAALRWDDPEMMMTLSTLFAQHQRWDDAERYATRLTVLRPGEQDPIRLLETIRRQRAAGQQK